MRFLGLDSSTQSLTALLVDTDTGEVIDRSVAFGARLPQYKSPNGFLAHADPRIKHSDPLMWVEALDLLLGELRGVRRRPVDAIRGVSGAGQQHGSVYLERSIDEAGHWDPSAPLVRSGAPAAVAQDRADLDGRVDGRRVRRRSPKAAGGDDRMVAITGSRRDRTVHRPADPQVLEGRSGRLRARPPRSTWCRRSWRRC